MSPAQRLYAILKEAFPDCTDEQVGAKVGVTKGAVSLWRNGEGNVRPSTVKAAAKLLGMSFGELWDKLDAGGDSPGVSYDPEAPPP